MSSSSTTDYASDDFLTTSAPRTSATFSTSTLSNTATQGSFPKIIFQLMENGLTSANAQIKGLLTDLKYSENIYALKYVLEHRGDSVSVEMLDTAVKSLYSQEFDEVFSGETAIKFEWQLRIIVTILELMCQKKCQFTHPFINGIRQATSKYKNAHSTIMQYGGETWKPNFAGSNELDKTIKSFKCNYNSRYLLKLINNTLNTVCSVENQYQTSIDRAIAALKGLLVAVPGLAKVGIKLITGVEVPLGDFNIERSWKYFIEAFYVEPSGKPWYTTWRRLIILQNSLDKWCEQESAISVSFKERVLLEYLWYHISLCYAEDAAENQDVSDELWFGILDITQQLIQKTFSTTTQAICYYMTLDSLSNANTEFIQFKSIEVLLSLEAKNNELFVTTPDDIAGCDEKYIPILVSMYYYLKEKLVVESKMILEYSPDQIMTSAQNKKQQDKGKGKGKGAEKNLIDFIAEDLTCAIVCEAVGDFYQLNCQHIISSKALLSLNNLECPYCRSEIQKEKVYYMPQQTIYNNVQHYLTNIDDQDTYDANTNAGNYTETKIFDECDDLKKQKGRNRTRKYGSESTLISIWRSLTTPNIDKLFQKAKTAYKNDKLEKALSIYTQILQADPANYVALCNRAKIKLDMKNFRKALFDIETASGVNTVYDDGWYLSLVAHVGLENKKEAEQDIGHISCPFIRTRAFDVIKEYVNKLEHFDVEWFKILVDNYTVKAMDRLNNINQWQSLCHQYGTDDYTRWYNTAVTWYNKYNNAPHKHTYTKAFYKKVYYMHKSKGLHLIA